MYHCIVVVAVIIILLVGASADDYIIVLMRPGNDEKGGMSYLNSHLNELGTLLKGNYIKYSYGNLAELGFFAYSIALQPEQLRVMSLIDDIKFIEPVGHMTVAGMDIPNYVRQKYLRLEEPALSHEGFCIVDYDTYTRRKQNTAMINTSDLPTIDVFVLDTGVQTSHVSFDGRAEYGIDLISPDLPFGGDPHGHGTQVAGIVGSDKYGVNRNTRLIDVRVMTADGRGQVDVILAGLDYVLGRYMVSKESQGPLSTVACMSMTGPPSQAMRHALFHLSKAIIVVTAMGDSDSYSCSVSPALSPYALSVGAVDRHSNIITGSNFGDCVDIYAPGEDIPGPWIGASNSEERVLTGTSASAAIVTGIVANIMSDLRSPSLIYTKSGGAAYQRFIEIVRPEDSAIFTRNILLSSVYDESEEIEPCVYSLQEAGYMSNIVNQQLIDIDTSLGQPASFQRLKNYRVLNQRHDRERYYLD